MANTTTDADVVVIGSGVLGALAAYELAKAGKSVLIIEAGPRIQRWQIVEAWRNSLNKTLSASPYPNPPHAPNPFGDYLVQKGPIPFGTNYVRAVGGTTWHWTAAAWRLIPNDFKLKSVYGKGRDWPISYEDLEPFYARAEAEMGVNGNGDEDQSGRSDKPFPHRSTPYPMEGQQYNYMQGRVATRLLAGGVTSMHEPNARATRAYDDRPPCAGNNTCTPICPIGAKYQGDNHIEKAERLGAKVLENSVVYNIEVGTDGKIAAVHYRRPDKTEARVTGKYFILAAHGIEAPKLLLMSTSPAYPRGVANSSDQVGRNLMDHTGISMVLTVKEAMWPGDGPPQLLVMMQGRDGAFRKDTAAYKHKIRNATNNLGLAGDLIKAGVMGSKLDKQLKFNLSHQLGFATDFEVLPNPNNRIVLSKEKFDALGLPVPEIHYDVDDYWNNGRDAAIKDYHRFAELLGGEITTLDVGHQNREHLMGTTIMGADPKDSVVDGNCRSHDHANLFIIGTGVMPAVGCVNPTLTGAALSLRMAEVLKKEV